MNPKLTEACVNCGTIRYPIHAKGYCEDCYRLVRRKAKLQALEWVSPFPPERPIVWPEDSPEHPRNDFLKLKEAKLQEIDDKLQALRGRELDLSGPIDGMDVEIMFRNLAKQAGVKEDYVLRIASEVTASLGPKQRRILFRWLNEIDERVRLRPRRQRRRAA